MRRRLAAVFVALPLVWHAPLPADPSTGGSKPDQPPATPRLSPALDLLPDGSTLTGARIPRYNAQRQPVALLRAGRIKVISGDHLEGQNIEVQGFDRTGRQSVRVHLGAAEYFRSEGILEATEVVTVTGDGFRARGTGAVFDLETRRGYLFGQVQTALSPVFLAERKPHASGKRPTKPKPQGTDNNDQQTNVMTRSQKLIAGAMLVTALGSVPAKPPEYLTPAQIEAMDESLKPRGNQVIANTALTRELLTRSEQNALMADVGFRSFATKVGRPELVPQTFTIANEAPADEPVPTVVAAEAEKVENEEEEMILVTCSGGMYFDADAGHLVYLEDIEVTEPRFTLTCQRELKIILEKKPQSASETPATDQPVGDPEPAPPQPEEGKENEKDERTANPEDLFKGPAEFTDVKTILATGKVVITRPDPKGGDPIVASAEAATFDAKSGDVVLRGGFPTLRQGKNSLRAREPGLYLKIMSNGDLITERGRWETSANLKTIQGERDEN